jgi:hypothetical protein
MTQWPRGLRRRSGIAGSNHARGMDVCLLCFYVVLSCVGRGLCDGLMTRPEESYRVSNRMCDHRNPEKGPYVPAGNLQENEWRWMTNYDQLPYIFYTFRCCCSSVIMKFQFCRCCFGHLRCVDLYRVFAERRSKGTSVIIMRVLIAKIRSCFPRQTMESFRTQNPTETESGDYAARQRPCR